MSTQLREIIEGLSQEQKTISPKFFYDERGSRLFDKITELPEYYLTDAELEIMQNNIDEMAALIGKTASLIEFGSGSSLKTRILLENLADLAAYVPVDISEEHLFSSARQIRAEFPGIDVRPVVADFTRPFALPSPTIMPIKNVVYFPGSTIGNFKHETAMDLLRVMHDEAGDGGALLIGVDLQKDPDIIDSAYNDSAGVTAEFNLNMLRHLNKSYDANFDLDAFEHSATYDEDEGRVVIELVSQADQTFEIGNKEFAMTDGETILTEYSHKYTLEGFAQMASEAGFRVEKVWTDASGLFSVQYCIRN
ncbi:MAG: L-histidine N(alpha)-methyltransferase [Gammaproteobacteria bacterium]|nr:L-histidine N(alpha)-methyltransferase [Gammaproteobacteria bacterium]MBT8109967.1 L-histidine N(alpha)-methyltransferase [Gammaproteobacteria bacterium]NND47304.1 L-histidine N(alpha)-methyltransferase [Woeseiaceae bacterium]NNL44669.1 L-histidine N(alpha)-methyltransferase [Woeseiaceae bacterium]